MDFEVNKPGRYVLDFKNTSIIGHFRQVILDAKLRPIADMQGGIQSTAVNPFFFCDMGERLSFPPGVTAC